MSNPIFGPILKGEEPKFTSRNEVLNKFSRNSRRQVRSTQQRIDHRIHLFDKSQIPGFWYYIRYTDSYIWHKL